MNSDANWAKTAQQIQETFGAQFKQVLSSMGGSTALPGMASSPPLPSISFNQEALQKLQQTYLAEVSALWSP